MYRFSALLHGFHVCYIYLDGQTVLRKGKRPKFYEALRSYKLKKRFKDRHKNQYKLAILRKAAAIEAP